MNFSCSHCHRTFQTTDEAVPGRVYRVPCKCGNTIEVEIAEPTVDVALPEARRRLLHTPLPGIPRAGRAAAAAPAGGTGRGAAGSHEAAASVSGPGPASGGTDSRRMPDDPFARALTDGRGDVTPTVLPGALALRDPDADPDESTAFGLTGAASVDDLLRRVRVRAFLAGSCAGAIGTVLVALGIAFVSRWQEAPVPPPAEPPPAMRAAEPAPSLPPAAASPLPVVSPPAPAAAAAAAAPPPPAASPPPAAPKTKAAPQAIAAVPQPAPARAEAAARKPPQIAAPAPGPSEAASPAATEPPAEERPAAGAAPAVPDEAEPSEPPADAADPHAAARATEERVVLAALQARRAELDACFADPEDAAVARGKRFRLVVIVSPSGLVSDARADDPDIDSSPAGACLARIAHGLSFSPFEGEAVRVDLPLRYGKAD